MGIVLRSVEKELAIVDASIRLTSLFGSEKRSTKVLGQSEMRIRVSLTPNGIQILHMESHSSRKHSLVLHLRVLYHLVYLPLQNELS
jgi:hypothetical protein